MLYKRAMFTHSFDSMLREEELKIMKDPKKSALYKLEMRGEDASSHIVKVEDGSEYERDTRFLKQDSNYHKIQE